MATAKEYQSIKEAFDTTRMFTKELTECDLVSIRYLRKFAKGDVLEIGCGKGNIIEKLDCNRHAIDLSSELLKYCEIDKKQQGNMDELPYPTNTFDLVYMVMTLQQSIDPRKTIFEAERVTKNGGRLVIIDGDKNSAIGKEREKKLKVGEWETCGKAQWFTEDFFRQYEFETGHLVPHIIVASRIKDDWAMCKEALDIIKSHIKPNDVVIELGSGKSTSEFPEICDLYSFENNSEYLTPFSTYSSKDNWYDIADFPKKIDILIVDGPCGLIKDARKPAEKLFARSNIIFIHDSIREDEKKIIEKFKGEKIFYDTKHGLTKLTKK